VRKLQGKNGLSILEPKDIVSPLYSLCTATYSHGQKNTGERSFMLRGHLLLRNTKARKGGWISVMHM
jgi:hypothetical protein